MGTQTLDSRHLVCTSAASRISSTHPNCPYKTYPKMKWMILTVCLALFAQCQAEEEAGDARLGYITVGNSGATTLTFNATSIQNAIILGLFILVLGALVLPLFGVSMDGTYEEPTGYGYGYDAAEYAYDPANYQQYQKRSAEHYAPIVAALSKAEEQYQ